MKKPKVFHSIRWRLVTSYVLLSLLTVSIVGVVATEIVRRYVQDREVEKLQANAQSLAQELQPLMWVRAPAAQIHSLTKAASFLGDVRIRVLDKEGLILSDSGSPAATEELVLIYPPEGSGRFYSQNDAWFNLILPVMDQHLSINDLDRIFYDSLPQGTTFQFIQRSTGPWGGRISFEIPTARDRLLQTQSSPNVSEISRSAIVVRERIGASNDFLGYVEISAGQDYGSAALATTKRAFLLAGAGATILAVVIGLVMSQRLTTPLRELREKARLMGAGDLSARADYRRSDEIGDLAAQFNQMADQLQENFIQVEKERDSLRRFISNASHELRTPVTALKNFLSLIQGPAAQDPPAQSEFLAESQIQIERLEWITRNLLDLSRLDAGLVELDFADHDVGELMLTAATPFKPLADAKNITLKIHLPDPPLMVRCDAPRLELVLSNLLDNAIKFTLPGGSVSVAAKRSPDDTQIWVADTGIGIHPDEIPHIFDRFYRGRQHTEQGSGLGLAIAKSIVEAQGGELLVESAWGEGAKFIVRFSTSEYGSESGMESR